MDISQVINRQRRKKPEVLAPAGNLRSLQAAIDYGADAVYCGGKEFGMRSAPKNFSLEDFSQAASYAHERGARVYVTCNILPKNDEIVQMNHYIKELSQTGVDALIVTDIGVLMAAKQYAPELEIHISTQAGVTNYQAAMALYNIGASRVVLARELDLQAIAEIRANVPEELEIECFVHGSMCMAFSGRCIISSHLAQRDANHGDCAQSCRWQYHVVEEKRPGEFLPVEVTDEGTYIFNSQDMNLLPYVSDLLDVGITSIKIEGRAKSAYYAAAMANAYGYAVDTYMYQRGFEDETGNSIKPFKYSLQSSITPKSNSDDAKDPNVYAEKDIVRNTEENTEEILTENFQRKSRIYNKLNLPDWVLEEPYKVTHRDYCTGFYYSDTPASESVKRGGYINDWILAAEVVDYDEKEKRLRLFVRNKIEPGNELEILLPRLAPIKLVVPEDGLEDADGNPITMMNHPAREYSLPCEFSVPSGAMVRTRSRLALRIRN